LRQAVAGRVVAVGVILACGIGGAGQAVERIIAVIDDLDGGGFLVKASPAGGRWVGFLVVAPGRDGRSLPAEQSDQEVPQAMEERSIPRFGRRVRL